MSITEDIQTEALKRYPHNHIVDDPHGATGEAESDPYGYNEEARQHFTAGAEWAAGSRTASPDRTESGDLALPCGSLISNWSFWNAEHRPACGTCLGNFGPESTARCAKCGLPSDACSELRVCHHEDCPYPVPEGETDCGNHEAWMT